MKKLNILLFAIFFIGSNYAQELTTVLPEEGFIGQQLQLTITGQQTNFSQGSNTIWLNQGSATVIYPQSIQSISDEEIKADFFFYSWYQDGVYNVNVENQTDGHMILGESFYLWPDPNASSLTDVNPDHAYSGETISLTISGQNTSFNQGSNIIFFYQGSSTIYPNSYQSINNETIEAEFTFDYEHPCGIYDIGVNNILDGNMQLHQAFELIDPAPVPGSDFYLWEVEENTPSNTELFTIEAEDNSPVLRFEIVEGNEENRFVLGEYDGIFKIAPNAILDYEELTDHQMKVWIYDDIQHTAVDVLIKIINLNDIVPTLMDATLELMENSVNGTEVGQLDVFDADGDINNFDFSIEYQSLENTFSIGSSTGIITVADSTLLNYEINTSGDLVITVSDGLFTDTKTYTVNILDLDEVGINEEFDKLFNIYPNPVKDVFFIEKSFEDPVTVDILDVNGKVLESLIISDSKTRIRSLAKQSSGIYFLRLIKDNKHLLKKIVLE